MQQPLVLNIRLQSPRGMLMYIRVRRHLSRECPSTPNAPLSHAVLCTCRSTETTCQPRPREPAARRVQTPRGMYTEYVRALSTLEGFEEIRPTRPVLWRGWLSEYRRAAICFVDQRDECGDVEWVIRRASRWVWRWHPLLQESSPVKVGEERSASHVLNLRSMNRLIGW